MSDTPQHTSFAEALAGDLTRLEAVLGAREPGVTAVSRAAQLGILLGGLETHAADLPQEPAEEKALAMRAVMLAQNAYDTARAEAQYE